MWNMYSKDEYKALVFTAGQNIEQAEGPGIHQRLPCKKCGSLVNIGNKLKGSYIGKLKKYEATCSCCGKTEHFTPLSGLAPCDEYGNVITEKI